jgi:Icc-related predicted phosphoesterase
MLRLAVSLVRLVSAFLLLGAGLFVANFYASTGPRAHPNPTGEVAPPSSGAFSLVALSDLKARSNVLLRAYEEAGSTHADAIVIGGDLVQQNSEFEYRYAARLLEKAPAGIPTFVAFGNHEAWDRDEHHSSERFTSWFGPPQTWFETKGVLFVALDTADYAFDEARAREAESILEKRRRDASRCVLVSHILPQVGTPLEGKRGAEKQLKPADSQRILDLVERFQVDLVLGGHYHGYAASKHGATTLLLTGGGGAGLDGPSEFHHFLRVTLDERGVSHEVVRIDSPHGVEWLRYQALGRPWAVLTPLALAVAASSFASRRLSRPRAPAPSELA